LWSPTTLLCHFAADHDAEKASWIINTCNFIIVDGHHRHSALKRLVDHYGHNVSQQLAPQKVKLNIHEWRWLFLEEPAADRSKYLFALQVDATIMYPLTEEEQFVFSERANASNQEGQVRLTVLDRIYHIRNLRTLR
jgi:hypothetical protein